LAFADCGGIAGDCGYAARREEEPRRGFRRRVSLATASLDMARTHPAGFVFLGRRIFFSTIEAWLLIANPLKRLLHLQSRLIFCVKSSIPIWPAGAIKAEPIGLAPAVPAIITRFPPEPNGYLHIGHAKSICLNFGLAADYSLLPGGARCNMRLDDTNPTKEDVEYADSILDAVQWLGFNWNAQGEEHLYHASDYFDRLYEFAELLIESGKAYVDSQSADAIHANRGNFNQAGTPSPFRDRSPAENLQLFREMRDGKFADGTHVLRLKIDMAHPNIVMRDPVIYRIRHVEHHRTGNTWCIYPLYDFTHCISDALENVSHSICTLEFENNRPLYDWILNALKELGVFTEPLPHQHEFARLNLTHTLTSKRKLLQLVEEKKVDGWDDPRMPTIVGIRRRATPLKVFACFVSALA
jgi:glutaminyl-tRNA synthetase